MSTVQTKPFSIAIVGAGVSGLSAAWRMQQLNPKASICLFEANQQLGGHANTVNVELDGKQFGVDTGFLVYNERTYPNFIAMLDSLGVHTSPSDMGFSVQVRSDETGKPALEWAGNSLSAVFAQRKNIASLAFWSMLKDMLRFNRLCTQLASSQKLAETQQTVGAFLEQHRFGESFKEHYFLPMIACIWSCPTEQMMSFPMATLVRFCHNHGLLQILNRPQWYTVTGGSRSYVNALENQLLASGTINILRNTTVKAVRRSHQQVTVVTENGEQTFDGVLFACHSDQALNILQAGSGASDSEQAILGAIQYQKNKAVLHTDESLLPSKKRAWAAWNYEKTATSASEQTVCLHYWLNKLQPLPTNTPVLVSLNPIRQPKPSSVIQSFDYAHPVFDQAAIHAQTHIRTIQGSRTWFAGAWVKYGFHEDGFTAGKNAAELACAELNKGN